MVNIAPQPEPRQNNWCQATWAIPRTIPSQPENLGGLAEALWVDRS